MTTYKYRAKKGPSDIVEGTVDAQSEREAIEKVSRMGYIPIRIQEGASPGAGGTQTSPAQKGLGRIRSKEITVFTRQLASLLKSGVPILKALGIISEQSENENLKRALETIHDSIKDGSTLSSTLEKYPRVFSSLYVALVRTGENSGSLPDVLFKIADYRGRQEEILSRFRMAMAYPIFMALVGVATVVFMLTYVMPRLMGIFTSIGQSLPLPTRILMTASQYLRQSWFWIILITAIIVLVIKRQAATNIGKRASSLFKLHMPIFGPLMLKLELSRFCRTLEVLIKSGVSILKAIDIAIPVLNNEVIKEQLRHSYKELEQGGSFGRSLKNSRIFPIFMSNLIIVGEESGRLDEALAEVTSSYEREADEAIRIMTSLLEPLMILVMGLIVGFIVIAMLLPIFEINVMVR